MNKLSLSCECGQEMIVPESALGKAGLCPGCGAQVPIREDNTRRHEQRPRRNGGGLLSLRRQREEKEQHANREEAWRNFAAAVDLYNARKYAEALTLLNNLIQKYPGNPHIETAREQCLDALQRIAFSPHNYDGEPVDDAVLSPELVKSVVLEKMLHGGTEDVQLRAAELAARMLGIHEAAAPPPIPEAARAPEPEPLGQPALEFLTDEPGTLPSEPATAPATESDTPPGNGHTPPQAPRVYEIRLLQVSALEKAAEPVFLTGASFRPSRTHCNGRRPRPPQLMAPLQPPLPTARLRPTLIFTPRRDRACDLPPPGE